MLTFKQFNNVSVLSKNGSNGNRKRNVFSMFYTIFYLIQRRIRSSFADGYRIINCALVPKEETKRKIKNLSSRARF